MSKCFRKAFLGVRWPNKAATALFYVYMPRKYNYMMTNATQKCENCAVLSNSTIVNFYEVVEAIKSCSTLHAALLEVATY